MDIDWEKVENDISAFGIEIYPLEKCIIGDCLRSEPVLEVFEGRCNVDTITKNVTFKRHLKFKNLKLEQEDINNALQDFRHEITLMKSLKYPTNVAQIYGVTFKDRKPILIVEVGDKTLDKYLLDKAESSTPTTWCEKIKLCKDISRGVRCLHEAGITHGDIKGENVFVFIEATGVTTAKLSGFGHSSMMNSSNGDTDENKIFTAPETRRIEELKAWAEKPIQDIFNFGLVTYQIANDGKATYEDSEGILKVDFTNRHTEVLLMNLRPDTPDLFRNIIISTTKYMPTERVSLDIVEKIIYNFQNVSSSQQVNTENIPLLSLGSSIESRQSHLSSPSALKTILRPLSDSKKSDELKDNSKEAELSEAKRCYEKAKNTLESNIVYNEVLDINKLPIPPSLKQSIFCEYQQLAGAGDAFAQFMLGICFLDEFGTERNYLKAVENLTKAAEAGNVSAQNALGFCYKEGKAIIMDITKGLKWYAMAAEGGNVKAQFNLGDCYQYGEGVTKDYIKAVEWYTKAAEANFRQAQNNLAILYDCGYGVKKDIHKAFELYTKAAEAGDEEAQHRLGLCYQYGRGVTKDIIKAVEWFQKGAEGGSAGAQHNLGYCYQIGKGISKNELEAVKLYTKSAEANNQWGQNSLGFCYEYGIGVSKDYNKAIELYTKAAARDLPAAKQNLYKLRMSKQ